MKYRESKDIKFISVSSFIEKRIISNIVIFKILKLFDIDNHLYVEC